ncbi:MAG: tRNA (adenosine(37)-N6)-threonylcarbamoyltransferase complex ATPase subunit type 1 TsaE [Bacteroidales bacterium]|jgi:tRNA threonylcarbamoyladenosine biosynthesis protein TsaE|nr:tRNA (adenosine(37)-N6)-threonylcarbamoyltransferase complex ATPase subunit type 1 TsaE [Bacteroidales bacterium]
MKEYIAKTLSDLPSIARNMLSDFENQRIFAFKGDMGVGKTTFIKALCDMLGVKDDINSPTFAIVNTYLDSEGAEVYHFDFYRLNKDTDAYDIGFEEYLDSGNYCFIEWTERIERLLPPKSVLISMTQTIEGTRIIRAS